MNLAMLEIDTDVLVIGSGFAGLWAAIRARDFVDKVVLVEKGKAGKSGCSTLASGVQLCVLPGDNLELFKRELVEQAFYFADQDWLDIFLENQLQRIQDYIKWGAPIEMDDRGQIARAACRGHINLRAFMFRGRKLMDTLARVAMNKGVKIVDRVMVTDLLTSDGLSPTRGSIVGAVGLDTRSAEIYIFKARATVLASGGVNPLKANRIGTITGDGQRMAFLAGAELHDLEFSVGAGNLNCWERKGYAGGINMFQAYGAKMVNARGERFMDKYEPTLQERARQDQLFMAYIREVLEGRGPIYFDMRHLSPETIEKFRKVAPHPMKLFDKLGIDLSHDLVENSPAVMVGHLAGQGGIKLGLRAETSIPGLYAAGAVSNSVLGGAAAIGSVPTATCNVQGYVAGENAGRWAKVAVAVKPMREQMEETAARLLQPLGRKNGLSPNHLRLALLQRTVPAQYSLIKDEKRLADTLAAVTQMAGEVDNLAAPDPHELVKVHEMRGLFLMTELALRGASERKESRGFHYREDYPYTDNADWLRRLVFKKQDHGVAMEDRPLPFDRWSYRPQRSRVPWFIKLSWPGQSRTREGAHDRPGRGV